MSAGKNHLAERRAELARRLAALTPEQREQLDGARPTAAKGIEPRAAGAPVPMSYAQELLWLLEQANPGMHGYNVPRTARLRGPLDVEALEHALTTIVARHEVLRSTFDSVDGELQQIVGEPRPLTLQLFDLRNKAEATREERAVALVRELSRRPFDLTKDSQLRSTLIRLADDDSVLLLESHHVASDAWSRNILLRELAALYESFAAGRTPDIGPVALQYGDFAIWQRTMLSGDKLETLLDYWRTQLRDAPTVIELPTDRPRAATPSFDGDARWRMLPLPLLEKLRTLSRANETTLFMTLLAAFDILLARYSGQDDIVVGSPIAGRAHEGTEGIIGYFANTLVLRVRTGGDPTFVELLRRVRETTLGAFEHQDVPYEKLTLELQRERSTAAASLFQVMFTLQDAELRSMQLPGLAVEPFGSSRGATKFDLSLFMHEQPGGLRAAIEFRTDLYDGATIERMLAQLEVLLENVVADPHAPISSLSLLPAEERTTLEQWSTGPIEGVPAATLHEFIAQQASRTPDAVAVESEGATPDAPFRMLTFRELEERATVVSRYLATKGVGPNVGVGICIDRSTELVVAILGVLKAGGYYLPLDPDYPSDRLAFMIEDAKVPVLLTMENVRGTLEDKFFAALQSTTVVSLDSEWESVIAPANGTPMAASPSDLAYVIYTSGSTGKPKGVMIPHRAVVNYCTWMKGECPLDTRDAVMQKAPASFDACIWEFFLPLVSGARLVMARPGGHRDPAYMLEALAKHDITYFQLVPSQLQMVLETPGAELPNGLPRLRRLFLGGEALPSELLTRVSEACPTLPITNLYGPTECTVYSTHWSVGPGEWRGGFVPIGTPIFNTTINLIDASRQRVPVGVPGELCIGGLGLANGYLNREELTAEKFIPDPFDGREGARLYRTGDRARYRADGTLEYMGRLDTQVKLRGFRVELGEIENALVDLPEVQSAVVLVREDTPGDQRLVAYCIAAGSNGSRPTAASLRDRIKTSLPVFMLPSAFVWLEEWPMNANGKLDRTALPSPFGGEAVVTTRVAPRTATERGITTIWTEILKRDVGVEDDFFESGGHSLLALRVLARIADTFGTRVPLRALFESPTIAQLAAVVDAAGGVAGRTAMRIPRSAGDAFPLTPSQELLWLVQRTAPESGAYNIADQWRVRGELDAEALAAALTVLVRRHASLRSVVEARESGVVQVARDAQPVTLVREDVSVLDETTRAAKAHRMVRRFVATPFDLEGDQLLRALLIRLAPDDHLFVTVSHHIALDGWSRGIMLRDLSAAYDILHMGGTPDASEPPLRYGDFAQWQREQLTGGGFASQLEKWREVLDGASLTIDVPTDRPRPDVPRFAGAKKTVVLPVGLKHRLRALASAHDATLYMVLLAAFQTFLHRVAGQADIVVQTTTAGRPRAELDQIVGYFASTLAVRARFEDDPTFVSVLAAARESSLTAAENADVPFAELSSMLKASGTLAQGDGIQVMFLMQNNESAALRLGPSTLEARGVDAGVAKMDLMLSTGEQSDGLRLALEYSTDLFGMITAERFVAQITALLDGVATDPSRRVSEYQLDSVDVRSLHRAYSGIPAATSSRANAHRRGDADRIHPYVPPRTLLEHELAQIWELLFPSRRIGIQDDFFEIGGHSLLAMKMLAEVERMRGRRVPLAWLFESSTIEKLGARLGAEVQATKEPPVVVLQGDTSGTPIAFVHGDVRGGGWYCRRLAPLAEPGSPFFLMTTLGMDEAMLPWTVESMARIHVSELRKLQPHGPYRVAGFCSGGLVAYEMARQLRAMGQDVERLIIMDASAGNARIEFVKPMLRFVRGSDDNDRLTRRAAMLKRMRYYSLRARQVQRQPMRERFGWLTTNVSRRVSRLFGGNAPQQNGAPYRRAEAPQADDSSALRTQLGAGPGTNVLFMHTRAASVFFPKPYDGCVELIWADERADINPADPTRGWGRVADSVRVYPLVSSHLGLVTNNISLLAGALRAALRANSSTRAARSE